MQNAVRSAASKKQKNKTELMHNSQSRGRAASHQKLRPVTRRKIKYSFQADPRGCTIRLPFDDRRRRVRAQALACLATVTSAWLLESFRQAPAPQAIVDARAIRDALRKAGYTSRALGARVLGGTPVAAAAAPTQVLRRTPEGRRPRATTRSTR